MPEIRNLSFSYDGTPVFSGLCLSLPDGSRTALLAPSGFGKTTLLRLLCGSLTPQSGSITGLPAEGIAMVFQEDRLLPGCTVLENLRLVAPERPDTELTALLGELGLSGWENARPGKLSGGMRRRAAIAGRWYSTARWSSWTSRSRDWTKPPWQQPSPVWTAGWGTAPSCW